MRGGKIFDDPEFLNSIPISSKESPTIIATPRPTDSNPRTSDLSGIISGYPVTIRGARLAKDYSGDSCIIIDVEWSNPSSDPKMFITTLSSKAYQGGIALKDAYVTGLESESMTEIKNGAVLLMKIAFKLRDSTTPVEFNVEQLFDFTGNGKKLKMTYTIN